MSSNETKIAQRVTITRDQFFDFIKIKDFVDADTQHYLEYFDQFEKTGKKANWNWATFFIGIPWFFYRRMYLLGFLVLIIGSTPYNFFIVPTLFSPLTHSLNFTLGQERFWNFIGEVLLLRIPMAIYADYIYLRWVSYKIKRYIPNKSPTLIALFVYFVIYALVDDFVEEWVLIKEGKQEISVQRNKRVISKNSDTTGQ